MHRNHVEISTEMHMNEINDIAAGIHHHPMRQLPFTIESMVAVAVALLTEVVVMMAAV